MAGNPKYENFCSIDEYNGLQFHFSYDSHVSPSKNLLGFSIIPSLQCLLMTKKTLSINIVEVLRMTLLANIKHGHEKKIRFQKIGFCSVSFMKVFRFFPQILPNHSIQKLYPQVTPNFTGIAISKTIPIPIRLDYSSTENELTEVRM